MKNRKLIILFLSLALPVLIFLFLKIFGKNQFDLTVFHTDASTWPLDCPSPTVYPYFPDLMDKGRVVATKPSILLLKRPEDEAIKRLPVEIDTSALPLIRLPESIDRCLFGAPSGTGAIIIDKNGAVRGIFAQLNREETDRLIMESKILLENY